VGSLQYRTATVLDRAHEIPLLTTEPSGSGRKNDRLVQFIHYNPKCAFVRTHANGTLCNSGFFARVAVPPAHAKGCPRSRVHAATSQFVDLKLQSSLETNPSSRSRHGAKVSCEWISDCGCEGRH